MAGPRSSRDLSSPGAAIVGVSLVAVTTALLLALAVYLTFGTRWGFETYLFPYLIGASLLPLVGALATRRYRLLAPTLLLSVGVLAFVAGVTANVGCLQGAGSAWTFTYDLARNVVRFGPAGSTCRAEPNAAVVTLGYALTTAGAVRSLDAVTDSIRLSPDLPSRS